MKIPFTGFDEELEQKIDAELSRLRGPVKGAFRRGFIAAREIGIKAVNPYKDKRKANGGATYATAFRRAWAKGWNFYKKNACAYCGIEYQWEKIME